MAIAFDRNDFFDEAELCLVKSYCKRNEAIPILVANDDEDDKTDLSLLPMLFQSAKQAPRTAPNAILMGLLAAGHAIGPHWQYGKRSRPPARSSPTSGKLSLFGRFFSRTGPSDHNDRL